MRNLKIRTNLTLLLLFFSLTSWSQNNDATISGSIMSSEKETINYATVYLKKTSYGVGTNQEGLYHISAPAGKYTLVVSCIGYETVEKEVTLVVGKKSELNVVIRPHVEELGEVTVVANGISRLNRSAYNAIGIDTKALQNSKQNLSEALARAPGLKLRESGGVGSDLQLMMDGFSGKHIKVFIDGVPQEGVGSSFGLNNIPVNYAERIEVYRGVVPVGFGTDAIGGVINIVTPKGRRQNWFVDASYSYGSFNTHKSYVNFGQSFKNGLIYEFNAFQNYSDNDYKVTTPVKDFETGAINKKKLERVKRFHDNYHNEAIVGKIGVVGKEWADRLMFGFTYSQMYMDIQTGVRQEIVFGGKHRKGHSLMPSVEYRKQNLIQNLDVSLTANYNKNITNNVDTSSYEYNWRGEYRLHRAPGEQSYQYTRSDNNNWNGTFTANYRIGVAHTFTFNHVLNAFSRSNESLLGGGSGKNPINKETRKNISGLSYRLMPVERWNASVFGKYYNQHIAGPIATTSNQDDYVRTTNSISTIGYGAAGTYYLLKSLQAKLSYEKAYRLPTNEEMFGDEDLETGDVRIKPEKSDNINLNLSYNQTIGAHALYLEGGIIYRNTQDYIQRKIQSLSGGKYGASYENHGRVVTKGYNANIRYGFANWVSVGGSFTQMNVRDKVKTMSGESSQKNPTYGARMPNLPYQFANSDISFFWSDFLKKDNMLTLTYDNLYMHSFPLYSEALGSESDFVVPTQFSHNLTLSYAMQGGRYNFSVECRNFTNEKMYDNFSLQKAGRAFYGKVRVYFGK